MGHVAPPKSHSLHQIARVLFIKITCWLFIVTNFKGFLSLTNNNCTYLGSIGCCLDPCIHCVMKSALIQR